MPCEDLYHTCLKHALQNPSPLLQPSPTCVSEDYVFQLTLECLNIDSWLSANLGVIKVRDC
ncbi:hypothetical protein PSY31_23550, partial [Shigella flexneri]|nr:hypothetical protein [Shigella flexneri]